MSQYRSIVVNTDGSAQSAHTVAIAAALARRDSAGLTVTSAFADLGGRDRDHLRDILRDDAFGASPAGGAALFLHDITAGTPTNGTDVMLRSVCGEPTDALLRVASDVGADLIVVGGHDFYNPRWGRWREPFPSVVIRRANSDVLVVNPAARRR
jgi:nucleotide-binding universal stress UspA family protein